MTLPEGTPVIIHSLGPTYGDKTFRGIIKGVADDLRKDIFYIVEMVDNIYSNPVDYPYSHIVLTAHCLQEVQ